MTSLLFPIQLELVYHLNFWDRLAPRRHSATGQGCTRQRDAGGLSLDHLSLLLAFGVLF